MNIEKYMFEIHGDERGKLIAIEEMKTIPFSIKRVYYMYDTSEGAARGFHAHKNLQQILVCVSGHCQVVLDDGQERRTVLLDNPSEGLFVSSCIWREMRSFSPDAVLLVLASELYDEADYIRDYDEFLAYVNTRKDKE